MSQSEKLIGAVGLVRVGDLEVTVAPISQAEEMALDRQLRAGACAAAGDHYTRCKPLLDAMIPADRLEAVRELVRMTSRQEPPSAAALYDFRCSAEGVALELFARGKKMTPGLTLVGLRAIVTPVNADAIADGLFELIRGGDDTKS